MIGETMHCERSGEGKDETAVVGQIYGRSEKRPRPCDHLIEATERDLHAISRGKRSMGEGEDDLLTPGGVFQGVFSQISHVLRVRRIALA